MGTSSIIIEFNSKQNKHGIKTINNKMRENLISKADFTYS